MTHRATGVWEPYITCQIRCIERARKERYDIREKPFVTISRRAGAGGITIGEKLAAYLRAHDKDATCPWTVFDRNLVERVLEEHDFPKEYSKFMPEDKVSDIQDMIEEMFGLHPSDWTLVHRTSRTILHLAEMGYAVLVGRGSNMVTRKFLKSGIHVRLVGSLEKRIQHIQEYYQLDRDKAVEFVKKEDAGRRRYLKEHFDKDIDDPLLYDMVINTDSIPYDYVARIIGDAVLHLKRYEEAAKSCCDTEHHP